MVFVEVNVKKFSKSVNSMKESIMIVIGKFFLKERRVEKKS